MIGPDSRAGGKVLSRYQMRADAGQIAGPVIAGAGGRRRFRLGLRGVRVLMLLAALAWLPVRETCRRPPCQRRAIPSERDWTGNDEVGRPRAAGALIRFLAVFVVTWC
ncbi:hypothetical protein QJS66_01000 [Kocuria rhizophila]|nr:hypothetical protein QJS66_01000 [Kocuria rhizophila]